MMKACHRNTRSGPLEQNNPNRRPWKEVQAGLLKDNPKDMQNLFEQIDGGWRKCIICDQKKLASSGFGFGRQGQRRRVCRECVAHVEAEAERCSSQ